MLTYEFLCEDITQFRTTLEFDSDYKKILKNLEKFQSDKQFLNNKTNEYERIQADILLSKSLNNFIKLKSTDPNALYGIDDTGHKFKLKGYRHVHLTGVKAPSDIGSILNISMPHVLYYTISNNTINLIRLVLHTKSENDSSIYSKLTNIQWNKPGEITSGVNRSISISEDAFRNLSQINQTIFRKDLLHRTTSAKIIDNNLSDLGNEWKKYYSWELLQGSVLVIYKINNHLIRIFDVIRTQDLLHSGLTDDYLEHYNSINNWFKFE